jgi:predicted MFS family arabinose efflux permease
MRDSEPMPTLAARHSAPSLLPVLLAGFLALGVAMGIGRFAFTPIMPMMMHDAGIDITDGGWLAAANYLGYLVGALLSHRTAGREAAVIRYGLLATGALTLAMALPWPMAVMLALRFGAGVASALVLVAVASWSLALLAERDQTHLNGIIFMGVGTGVAGAGLLCLALDAAQARSYMAWATLGVVALLVPLLLWQRYQARKPEATGETHNADVRAAMRWNATNVRLVICYGLYGFGYIIPATFLPVMAKRALPDPSLVGWAWPLFGLAAAISTLLAAPLSKWMGPRRLWICAHVLMGLGVALPAWKEDGLAVFVSAIFVGLTFVLITVCAMQEARRLEGVRATPLMAAMTAAFAAGQVAGPLTVSLGLSRNGDFSLALGLAAVLLFASAAALAFPDASSDKA